MNCRDMVWRTINGLLLTLLLFGCDYGERNKNPIAQGETAMTARGVPVTIDVLANDSDPDGDPVTLVAWTQGGTGEVTRDDDGTLTYTPDEGFDGSDRFTYTIDDDHGGQAMGTVTDTVLPHPGVVAGGTLYTVQDISPLGVSQVAAWGLNDAGQIAASGIVDGEDVERPLFIDADGSIAGIFVPGVLGRGFGINNNGVVTGFFLREEHEEEHEHEHEHEHEEEHEVESAGRRRRAQVLTRITQLGAPLQLDEENHEHEPPADVGEGEEDHDGEEDHAEEPHEAEEPLAQSFLWDANVRSLIAIFDVPDTIGTFALKSNDAGVIVGEVQVAPTEAEEVGHDEDEEGDHQHEHDEANVTLGFIRAIDGTFNTFTIPGASQTFLASLNNRGQMVGGFIVESSAEGLVIGFLRQPDGTLVDFNVLDDDGNPLWTRADDVNDAGVIVGHFMPATHDPEDDHGHEHEEGQEILPFLRKPDGTILRFTLPDTVQARFTDINNRGVISGVMIDAGGQSHAMLLTPVQPAPNTLFRDTPADGDEHDHDH